MNDNVAQHRELCKLLNRIYESKNRDYGNSFHLSFVEEGVAMARIRLSDKLNRFKTLTRDPKTQSVKDESIIDTLLDLANYAIMTVMELDNDELADEVPEVEAQTESKPVCNVQYRGKTVVLMHGPNGYSVDSPFCTLCDLCKSGALYPNDAPCIECIHHTGDMEKFKLDA